MQYCRDAITSSSSSSSFFFFFFFFFFFLVSNERSKFMTTKPKPKKVGYWGIFCVRVFSGRTTHLQKGCQKGPQKRYCMECNTGRDLNPSSFYCLSLSILLFFLIIYLFTLGTGYRCLSSKHRRRRAEGHCQR
jgi:hypothetical protein